MTATTDLSAPVRSIGNDLVLAVAISTITDAEILAAALDLPPSQVRSVLADLEVPANAVARRTVLDQHPRSAIERLHPGLIDALERSGTQVSLEVLTALAASGSRDPRLVRRTLAALSRAAESEVAALAETARVLGADPFEISARSAERAVAMGDFDTALQLSEDVLREPDHPASGRAATAAAVAHAHRGLLSVAGDLLAHVPVTDADEVRSALAVWSHLGLGRLSEAHAAAAATISAPPTSTGRGLTLMARGLIETVGPASEGALAILVQSAAALSPVGRDLVLPESPAALAALVAIHSGELDIAESILTSAIGADLGGRLHRTRHRLLLAWCAMLRGDLAQAHTGIADLPSDRAQGFRDDIMVLALQVGLARRASDLPALDRAWRDARARLPEFSVDLFGLLPLGEFAVAAARLRESHRLTTHLRGAQHLLDTLGHPPQWSAMFHWSGIHAAILAESPAELTPHAEALVRAAADHRVAASLAQAAEVWVRVLQGLVDPAQVRAATGELDRLGLGWEAARLAAQAAGRTSNRQHMLELMQLARSCQRVAALTSEPHAAEAESTRTELTEREWEVALLVLAGVGYREIGERLFISPKTVEHHVARIRRRLGARSRAEMLTQLRSLAADR